MKGYVIRWPDLDHRAVCVLTQLGVTLFYVEGASFCKTPCPWGEAGPPERVEIPYDAEIDVPEWMLSLPEKTTEHGSLLCVVGEQADDLRRVLITLKPPDRKEVA